MIEVTRLNGTVIVLNSDLIKSAESAPDTTLTLINGEKLIVRENCAEILDRVMHYRAALLSAVALHREASGLEPELSRLAGATSLASDAWTTPNRTGLHAVATDIKRR